MRKRDLGKADEGPTEHGSGRSAMVVLRSAEQAFKNGRAPEAEALVHTILAEDPAHVGALEHLAKIQWRLKNYGALLETLAMLIRINPYEPGYHVLRGNALRDLGRYGDSVRSFVRAGKAVGAEEAVAELSALQSELVLHLLAEDPVFKAHYSQDPEGACAARGFEFGSEKKVRHHVLANQYRTVRLVERPS